MYNFIYKTTCLVSNKFYYGMHSTNNLNDGYLGSGKILRHSINKHGENNHIREILEFCETREQLKKKESEIVTLDVIKDKMCMNLRIGGEGGFTKEEQISISKKRNLLLIELWKNNPNLKNKWKLSISNSLKGKASFKGKIHRPETIDLMSATHTGRHNGIKNCLYGKCWIYNLELKVSKPIDKKEINEYLSKGWHKGRKMKFT